MGAVLSVAAVKGGVYYVSRRGIEATDDAQIEAEVVSVPTRAAGIVAKVSFTENQVVAAGDVLADLDRAKAHLSASRASTSLAQSRVLEAHAKLTQTSDVAAMIELAHARARVAHAQVATAQAARDIAQLEVGFARVVAPRAGVVSKKNVAIGQMVAPGQGVGQLVPTQSVWVTANFKETQVARMRAGQPVRITVDAYPGVDCRGEVKRFSSATRSRFSLLPPDNASGNFTKVVQRVPVRIKLTGAPEDMTLRAGMSADVDVDTRK
jgi:membrane fusion protein (multidrug efflux system)